ncbi:MAG: enoyl-CoA hydratase [Peptococcaceae bacterium]|nr:enoyl-CoA hydratase [Peptococcaceae bacterium]
MKYQNILFKADGKVGHLTLNRPEKRNPMSREMLEEITDLLTRVGREKNVHVVIIKGAGKVFSAGHDLREVAGGSPQEVLQIFRACYDTMKAVRDIPQPVIAQVHGIATAGGCQLVAACDLAVAAEDALFATPGAKIGFFCTTPSVFLSRNVGRKKAMEMLLTADFIPARDALLHGLVNKVVPPEELESATLDLANKIAGYSLAAIGIGKQAFYRQINMEDFTAFNYASEVMALSSTTEDAREGISAFLEKREPRWTNK